MSSRQWRILHLKHALTTLARCVSHCSTDTTRQERTHINFDLLAVRVFDRWVVAFDPDILDKLRWAESENKAHLERGFVNLTSEAGLAHAAWKEQRLSAG